MGRIIQDVLQGLCVYREQGIRLQGKDVNGSTRKVVMLHTPRMPLNLNVSPYCSTHSALSYISLRFPRSQLWGFGPGKYRKLEVHGLKMTQSARHAI